MTVLIDKLGREILLGSTASWLFTPGVAVAPTPTPSATPTATPSDPFSGIINPITYTPDLSQVALLDMTITGTNPTKVATTGAHSLRYADAPAWGEVPAGYTIRVTRVSDGAVIPASFQSLGIRPDGSLDKFELLIDELNAPVLAAYGAGPLAAPAAVQRYRLQAVPGTLAAPGSIPDSTFAAHDFKLRFIPYNDGTADTYWLSLNAVMAGAKGWPTANSVPRSHWRDTVNTPRVREVRAEAWFSTDGTATGGHRWLSGVLYVTALASGGFHLDGLAQYTNTFGPGGNGQRGGTAAPRRVDGEYALFDGTTLLKAWGGKGDPRALVVTFLPGRVVLPIGHALGTVSPDQYRDSGTEVGTVPVRFSSTGTLPPGIDPLKTYYLGMDGGRANGMSTPYVMSNERGTPGYTYPGWGTNQGHSPGDVVVNYSTTPNRVFRCTTGGTTATSGTGPAVYGSGITDGSVVWECLNPDTSGGSGTHTIYPVVSLINKTTAQLFDDDANPIQVGTQRTILMAGHDVAHLVQKSWLVPPFGSDSANLPDTAPVPPYSINTYAYQLNLNNYGDNPSDPRIGPINNTAAWGVQQPTSLQLYRRTLLEATMFAGYPSQFDDERTMSSVQRNLGPDGTAGTNWPGLAANNVTFEPTLNGSYGSPGMSDDLRASILSGEFSFSYQQTSDGSHYPVPSFAAYLRSGRTIYRDQLQAQANALSLCTQYYAYNPTINGRTYSNPDADFLRPQAWSWKGQHQCEWMLPDDDKRKALWQRQLKEQGDWWLAHIPEIPLGMKRLGLWSNQIEGGNESQAVWMALFCTLIISMVAGRGRYPVWAQAAGLHLFGFPFGLIDTQAGGSAFIAGAQWYRNFPDGDTLDQGVKFRLPQGGRYQGADLPFLPDIASVVAYNFGGSTTFSDTGVIGDYTTGAKATTFGGWPFCATTYQVVALAAVAVAAQAVNAMRARGEPVGAKMARAPRLFDDLNTRLRSYGPSALQWCAASSNYYAGGYNGCYPTFSAVPTMAYVPPVAATVLPGAPKNLAISYVASDAVGVSFDLPDNAGALPRFLVEVSADNGASWTPATTTKALVVRVACALTGSRSQLVRVSATNEVGAGPACSPVAATLLTPAAGPLNLHVTDAYEALICDAWTAVSGASSYVFEWKASSAATWNRANSTNPSYSLPGLTPGTSYDRRVSAVNGNGQGLPSAVLTSSTPAASGRPYSFREIHLVDAANHCDVGVISNVDGSPVRDGVLIGLSTSATVPPGPPGPQNGPLTNYGSTDFYQDGSFWVSLRGGFPTLARGTYYSWMRGPDGVDRLCSPTPLPYP